MPLVGILDRKVVSSAVLIFIITSIVSTLFLLEQSAESGIKNRKKIFVAKVRAVELTHKPVVSRIQFTIKYNDKYHSYYEEQPKISHKTLVRLKGHSILLVADSNDLDKNKLLLRQSDYRKFNVLYPDSLMWIKKLLGE